MAKIKHGHCSGYTGYKLSSEYYAYRNMKERCNRKSNKSFPDYGGRGIKVCDRWMFSFKNFIEDMGKKPSPEHSIDRIDNDKNYEPTNCRWGTDEQQKRNRRNNVWVEYRGVKMIMSDWARYAGTNYIVFIKHIRRGKTFEQAYNFFLKKNKVEQLNK